MPLYEYECDACGHRFEVIRKFSDAPIEKCPSCGGRVRKLMSSPAIQFKGSGWYVTDYPKKGEAAASESEGTSDAKKETKAETKSSSSSDAASTPSTTPSTSSSPKDS